jgi:transposase
MRGDFIMRELYWLSEDQLKLIARYFPSSRDVPRVDDLRVISGIIFVLKRGLQWRDAPAEYGPHKTLYNHFKRWSAMGVFDQIFMALALQDGPTDQLQIDTTHLKAHRTASSLLKKGMFPALSDAQKVA